MQQLLDAHGDYDRLLEDLKGWTDLPDIIVQDPTSLSHFDVAEKLNLRSVVLNPLSSDWFTSMRVDYAPKLGVPYRPGQMRYGERVLNHFWQFISPVLRLGPTLVANYHRHSRQLPLVADVEDYWGKYANIVPTLHTGVALPPTFVQVGAIASSTPTTPDDVVDSASRQVVDFIDARQNDGIPVVYVAFGAGTWVDIRMIETIMWGLQDSRWAIVWNLAGPVSLFCLICLLSSAVSPHISGIVLCSLVRLWNACSIFVYLCNIPTDANKVGLSQHRIPTDRRGYMTRKRARRK